MTAFIKLRLLVALAACWLAAGAAHALTLAELQRLLQNGPPPSAAFEESRESPWLSAPAISRGTLTSTPQVLEKRVEFPRRETWRLLPDRIEWTGPGDKDRKQFLFSAAPQLQTVANTMRHAVRGDLAALERSFRIELRGDDRVWSALLSPRTPEIARNIESVELQGTGPLLRIVIVTERQGERTTLRIVQ